jgi:D-tyrosyl-tRNA(Tyr) deacylase
MKLLIQRANSASVSVAGQTIAEIGKGLLVLVGFSKDDNAEKIPAAVQKVLNLRVFPDQEQKFDRSLLDTKAELLLVSQFTLYADCRKGRRPDFCNALEAEKARLLYDQTVAAFRQAAPSKVQSGEFAAYMQVKLENDGPVTLSIEI